MYRKKMDAAFIIISLISILISGCGTAGAETILPQEENGEKNTV